MIYWEHEPYLGVGLSSHSYFDGSRFANVRGLQSYISSLDQNRLPTASTEAINGSRAKSDAAMLGLRLTQGIHLETFDTRFGGNFIHEHEDTISRMAGLKLIEVQGGYVRLSERGYLLANQVWQQFI
jgi:oxygen-independent coproporphyrinogen-3 oxidase